jgi:hypothetical protein
MAKPKGPASAGLFLERRSSSPLAPSRKLERCDDSATKSQRTPDSTVGHWGTAWGRLEGAAAGPICPGARPRRWSASNTARPSGSHTTASPSSVNDRAFSLAAAEAMAGYRSVQSWPRRRNRRTASPSRRTATCERGTGCRGRRSRRRGLAGSPTSFTYSAPRGRSNGYPPRRPVSAEHLSPPATKLGGG